MKTHEAAAEGRLEGNDEATGGQQAALLLQHAAPLSGRYPVWLCDIWGVVHDGVRADMAACDALTRHRANGGVVVLISNSPRPRPALIDQLDGLKVPRDAYDDVITSGDVTRAVITRLAQQQDRRVFHLGPERDARLREGLPVSFVSTPEEAEVIMCSGLFDDRTEQPEEYRPMLEKLASRQLPFVCANPDLIVKHGNDMLPCAGALAAIYEELGGEVIMAGKPHQAIYDEALRKAEAAAGRTIERREVLAIGDGMGTDMKGAADNGLDALFIAGGISAGLLDDGGQDVAAGVRKVLQMLQEQAPGLKLVGIMRQLQW